MGTIIVDGFFGYDKIRNMTIPGTVKKIGDEVFSELVFRTDDKAHKADHYDADWSAWGYKLVYHNFDSVTFQNGIEEIGEHAFMKATIKSGIVLPKSVKNIFRGAFSCVDTASIDVYGNVYMQEAVFQGDIVRTGKVAFHGNAIADHYNFQSMKKVKTITFDKDYKAYENVGSYADMKLKYDRESGDIGRANFCYSTDLEEVFIGGNAEFGASDFNYNTSLKLITVKGNATFPTVTFSGQILPGDPCGSATPKKLYIGGNAIFEQVVSESYVSVLEEVTVKGKVTQKKDSWKVTVQHP